MNISRREFIGTAAMAGATTLFGGGKDTFIWAYLVHLGMNSWADIKLDRWGKKTGLPAFTHSYMDYLRFDREQWDFVTGEMAKAGMNMIVIDLAEGVKYDSHPELAVKGSWSKEEMKKELGRLRGMGLEPIPKMNFSTCHDSWLKDYHRMVSSRKYYEVCSDLIKEVSELFGHPRYLHLGYDEENYVNQAQYEFVVVRQGELWWHDFLWFNKTVEALGTRTWIWADKIWHHREEFEKRMPRSVLMSNWYYGAEFDIAKIKNENIKKYVGAYAWLEKAGFDQIPAGSNNGFRTNTRNFQKTVEHCVPRIAPERLKGFCMASWSRQVPKYHEQNADSFVESAEAKAIYNRIKAG